MTLFLLAALVWGLAYAGARLSQEWAQVSLEH